MANTMIPKPRTFSARSCPGQTPIYERPSGMELVRFRGAFFIYAADSSQARIWTPGWTSDRIEGLLEHIRSTEIEEQEIRGETHVYALCRSSNHCSWDLQKTRPSRSLASFCIDVVIKDKLIEFIDDYVHPNTERWYLENEYSYKRGLLFHGKPGCGKTSLAIAAAGHFNLTVYTISLTDPGLSDSILLSLIQRLGTGDLLLLEDVDCTGIGRELPVQASVARPQYKVPRPTQQGGEESGKKEETPNRVTLSGLLSALDGVSSPEGHLVSDNPSAT